MIANNPRRLPNALGGWLTSPPMVAGLCRDASLFDDRFATAARIAGLLVHAYTGRGEGQIHQDRIPAFNTTTTTPRNTP